MEVELADVSFTANEWDVKRAIGKVLHSDNFFNPTDPKDRPANFKITLNPGHGGVQNNGTGTMTLGSRKIGDKFLRWLRGDGNSVLLHDRKIRFFRGKHKPPLALTQILDKAPYLDPEIEEEREDKLRKLEVSFHIDKIQFGVFYRREGSQRGVSREFSNEYEISHVRQGAGILWFEYDHKLIRIQMGNTMTEEIAHNIAVTFANIRRMAIGLDFGNPFICFDLLTPPMLERQRINRELTGKDWSDMRKFRQRLSSLNEAHAVVAPYAHQMRIILHEERDIRHFADLCKVAGVQPPVWANVESFNRGFFTRKKLSTFRTWVRSFDWSVAFQLEALLHNALLTTEDLLTTLYKPINDVYENYRQVAGEILRYFTEALRSRDPQESPLDCFKRVQLRGMEPPIPLPPGHFLCHHVTYTPTRMILEGPYVSQSNRVIRRYPDHQDHFLRVDFRDEDRLQYRWAREVDGSSLLFDRVGGVLRSGFELAGRYFEFLAYSQSALREHAVWFINPFYHPEEGHITAQTIRDSLGDFSGVIRQPSKYAARLAQAFTATDPSVRITRGQWEEMPDLGEKPYEFTDGVGTISTELGNLIWDALCASRPENRRRGLKPSAYQIRFLGYKGMVVIDEQLQGIKMHLRPSMNKFRAHDDDLAEIEIARAFERPGTSYLNRPLIMILEDRGVDKKAFINLQERAKTDIYTASDSITKSVSMLKAHTLGKSYGLDFILQSLQNIGMGFKHEKSIHVLQDPFIERLIHYSKNHVLRDIKHGARIPIPDSYLLVGVADEGPAYVHAGMENVFCLKKGEIFACVQNADDPEPTYLKGSVVISRSPVVHPGDVQRVWAIGSPPPDKVCFFRNLKNVVVLPSAGGRSLASCLGGGDLDGDLYSIIKHGPLLPTEHEDPASYLSAGTRTLDRDSTIADICDFVVEYLNSDVLGLLSDRHLIIADQSKHGTNDTKCLSLAELCSQAVDYPKNGIPVDIHDSPHWLIPYKPDWHQAEDAAPRHTDYYESHRALGDLFRNIAIVDPSLVSPAEFMNGTASKPKPLSDPISKALRHYIQDQLHYFFNQDEHVAEMTKLFQRYTDELRYICITHALSDASDVRLVEEEVVVGTILAKCTQTRWRTDRTYRMRLHSATLARHIVSSPDPVRNIDPSNPSSHLSKILIPRSPDTENNTIVKDYIVSTLKSLNWHVEEDAFTDDTPYGTKRFTNVIATKDPSAPRRVILSAHYDSKFFPTYPHNQFVGATDSAAPCAFMLDLAEALNPLLDKRQQQLENGEEDDDDVAETTLQLVFFDGEEAFKVWTAKDSVYGARHLAKKWFTSYIAPHTKRRLLPGSMTELSTVEHLILLDLLGAPNPRIHSSFLDTAWLFDAMASAEHRLGESGAFVYNNDQSQAAGKWKSFFVPRGNLFNQGGIEDDHVPFLHLGVSVLHVISSPFPSVWHTLKDDATALDIPTMRRWNLILRIFMSEYLGLHPETSLVRSSREGEAQDMWRPVDELVRSYRYAFDINP
ncbi:uncharacterized protein FIBRA_02029 [Fibroporia radiculosa]|uniref:Peptide hydrolase n=1 Tax=Fibroporia radiculosa TaxID=599839 RepID=J4H1L9_9APHY|nr:uncharacterized protein FIBRA_02029 [Fibroporia radiculosa]CCM00004.1 predicted protein [Fibroporia radiculosa]